MTNNTCILLVEDNPDEIILTQRALKRANCTNQIKVVTNGSQALDFLFPRDISTGNMKKEKPGLILLDLNLPLVSGLDVLKEVKTNPSTQTIPVVVLTSSTEDKDQTESYRLGANDFIRKPTGLNEFIEIIKSIKVKWLDCY
jgi:two-component system, response regulator